MADRKISDLTALTTPASGDYLPIVDISEVAAASKNKRITIEELMRGAPDGTAAAPSIAFESDPNTGIYSPGADQLAISTNGTGRLTVSTTAVSSTLAVDHPLGAVGTPSITFIGDLNTGFWSPAADTLAASTGGSERLRILSDGKLGLGTSSPAALFHATGAALIRGGNQSSSNNAPLPSETSPLSVLAYTGYLASPSTSLNIGAVNFDAVNNNNPFQYSIKTPGASGLVSFTINSVEYNGSTYVTRERLRIDSSGRVGIGTTSPGSALEINAAAATSPFIAKINTAEVARIDSSGRLLVGTSTNFDNSIFQNATTDGANIGVIRYSSNASAPFLSFKKSRGASIGTNTIVQSGDQLGIVEFAGANGTGFNAGACIIGEVDGTPGASNDMPGRLVFSTTADGASITTERMRITSAGVLQVADAGNIAVGTTTGTKIGTATTQKLGFYNATPVVQPAAVADATTAVDVITQLNDLLAKLRTLGIIAT
jgi:hypothetical protein